MLWTPLTLLLLAFTSSAVADSFDYSTQLANAVKSLNKLLDYMLEPRSVVGDMIFGVILAQGQLKVLKKHLLQSPSTDIIPDVATLSLLQKKCKEIVKTYAPIRIREEHRKGYNSIIDSIVKEELWEVDYPITLGKLRKLPRRNRFKKDPEGNPPVLSEKQAVKLLIDGNPKEGESDECIGLLITPVKCGSNFKCDEMMSRKDNETHGYSLTHRLLYLQIARQIGCSNKAKFFHTRETIKELCSKILVDLQEIIDLGLPVGFRDLFIEQISLCGIEGFGEFLNPYYVDTILPLQGPLGCFADDISESWLDKHTAPPSATRVKREDGDLEDDCTMHITGLAAFFLALNIRAIVEFWNPSLHIPPIL